MARFDPGCRRRGRDAWVERGTFVGWVAAIFTLVIGLGAVSSSLLLFRRLRQASAYLPVPGRIVERSVVGVLAGSGKSTYGPKVKYTYRVDGREYVNDRYAYFDRGVTLKKANQRLASIPDEVTVYVSPSDPTQAVIDRSGTGLAFLIGCIGVVAILAAALMVAMP